MIAYLSHSLGASNGDDSIRRQDNISNALAWLAFLTEATSWAITMPWYPNVVALRELHRPIAFASQLRILSRCDAIVLVGGAISAHMQHEADYAKKNRVGVVDLIDLGYYPPHDPTSAREEIMRRGRDAVALAAIVL